MPELHRERGEAVSEGVEHKPVRLPKILAKTVLELQIIQDSEWQAGLTYGKPRPGHPEGAVAFHINDVLANVYREALPDDDHDWRRLRLIALIHDTFKYQVDRTRDQTGTNHHGWYARQFAEQYIDDQGVLEVIELHDEAYSAWLKSQRQPDAGTQRAERLIDRLQRIGDLYERAHHRGCLGLYLRFFRADNATGDKQRDSLDWFTNIVVCYTRSHDPNPHQTTTPGAA